MPNLHKLILMHYCDISSLTILYSANININIINQGEFNLNKKHGRGIFTWATGNVYKGQLKEEKLCGKGEMTYTTGHR